MRSNVVSSSSPPRRRPDHTATAFPDCNREPGLRNHVSRVYVEESIRVPAASASGMPKVGGIPGPYSFYFFSSDCDEPLHIHVRREKRRCKIWLVPVRLAWNRG